MRVALVVRGTVQGVGFRPFVRRAALSRGLSGFVMNGRDAVRIEVQGEGALVASFTRALEHDLPAAAKIHAVTREELVERDEEGSFAILASDGSAPVAPLLPPDLGTCADCFKDVSEPGNRRFRYPFTNCVACGPRYSICDGLPYDRARTSMRAFPMCEDCAREYGNIDDRRYHAQPVACARCGPRLSWSLEAGAELAHGEDALGMAAQALAQGKIIALRGLGGFQLICDASSPAAVARLRERKRRPHKPFAVMYPRGPAIPGAVVSDAELALLGSPEAPIVLVRRLERDATLAPEVAPGCRDVGAMFPPSPLHALLLAGAPGPIVCTSGNVSEEPICIGSEEARLRLAAIADAFLTHDREIVRPLDDSLVRVSRGSVNVLRRARGYTPRKVADIPEAASVLALGAHLKSTIAVGHRGAIVPSQHLGDLESAPTRELFQRTIDDLLRFFDTAPRLLACDLHPDYGSSVVARELAGKWGVPLLRVQHHQAHVAACIAEHAVREDEPVLGLAWDGTGLGDDGTIWGGEAFTCRHARFTRVARLRPFPLPGGDAASRDPRRVALGLLSECASDELTALAAPWFGEARLAAMLQALDRRVNTPPCGSVGRLFDGIAALLGARHSTYEGQAAMELEMLAAEAAPAGAYPLPLRDGVADLEPLVRGVLDDVRKGTARTTIARRFHDTLIELAVEMARQADLERVAIAGGCFQNRLLSEGVATSLEAHGHTVLVPTLVPANDGGISVGQAWIAARDPRSTA